MSTPGKPRDRRSRWWMRLLPRQTLRVRLAILYGGAFLVSGSVLLAIAYAGASGSSSRSAVARAVGETHGFIVAPSESALPAAARAHQLGVLAVNVQGDDRHQLLIWSFFALAIMAVVSLALGWIVAGRALGPLRAITRAARATSASNLHERLGLAGPNDELRELGDTFDELLGRLESSFEAQRQFAANASHELRTPLTLERAILEVTLADPDADAPTLRAACERVLAIGEHQERTIEGLLTLARSERGLQRRWPVALQAITGAVVREHRDEIHGRGLTLDCHLAVAPTAGDPRLIERLVANLLDNAIRHNTASGWITVTTATDAGQGVLSVSNSGPVIAPEEVERLSQPFQRSGAERTAQSDGHGLGLSIVSSIATAHGARLVVEPQPAGGLHVIVSFPTRAHGNCAR